MQMISDCLIIYKNEALYRPNNRSTKVTLYINTIAPHGKRKGYGDSK
jgi:hypothetical protein